jgi:hypothetical protein
MFKKTTGFLSNASKTKMMARRAAIKDEKTLNKMNLLHTNVAR